MAATARRSAVLATLLKLPPAGSPLAVLVLGACLVQMGLIPSWSATLAVSGVLALSARQCRFITHAQPRAIIVVCTLSGSGGMTCVI
jgi:hypothetical protein